MPGVQANNGSAFAARPITANDASAFSAAKAWSLPQVVYVNKAERKAAATLAPILDAPTGLVDGDLMVAGYSSRGITNFTPHVDWKTIDIEVDAEAYDRNDANSMTLALCYKVWHTGDPTTWTCASSASVPYTTAILAVRGQDPLLPITGMAFVGGYSQYVRSQPFRVPTDNSMLLSFACLVATSFVMPGDSRVNQGSAAGGTSTIGASTDRISAGLMAPRSVGEIQGAAGNPGAAIACISISPAPPAPAAVPASQLFAVDGIWTKPPGTWSSITVYAIGGGAGGCAGGRSNGGSAGGGGGGGAGGRHVATILKAALGATETVTVGRRGAGGWANALGSTGDVGTAGTASSFGAHATANGGGVGAGGQVSASNVQLTVNGGTGGTGATTNGGDGGQGRAGATAVTTPTTPGGGGGGQGDTGTSSGGNGHTGAAGLLAEPGGDPGIWTGLAADMVGMGGHGVPSLDWRGQGSGGGGGTEDLYTATAWRGEPGGNGGYPGGGGGGGGGTRNTSGVAGGRGGEGAPGCVLVVYNP
jgi:glycine rich protein